MKRIVDKKLIQRIHQIGYCEYCGSHFNLQAHHIKSRGARGDDVPGNLILLCWQCHRIVHDGNISRDELREIVRRRQ
ncbi:MAG: hypothetical protein H6Q72_4135 [Firmicutes bacterium]|nr:hypothetical protein [Bacillota bacterium]